MTKNIKQHLIEIFPIAANVAILSIGATVYMLLYSRLEIHAYVTITLVMPMIQAGTQFYRLAAFICYYEQSGYWL